MPVDAAVVLSPSVSLNLVPLDAIDGIVPQCEHHIQRALDFAGSHTVADVCADLRQGKAQLWIAGDGETIDGIVVTTVTQYPQRKECFIWLLAGERGSAYRWPRINEMLGEIETWAKALDCDLVSLEGRSGWERVLPKYEKTKVILERRL
tara:strand:- start:119 stop:568 length:450 start_codon:yes stop_codon:yes gene_type:complete